MPLEQLSAESDIISPPCPLMPATRHLFNAENRSRLRHGVFVVNTSRGPLVDTAAVIDALKSGKLGTLALDE